MVYIVSRDCIVWLSYVIFVYILYSRSCRKSLTVYSIIRISEEKIYLTNQYFVEPKVITETIRPCQLKIAWTLYSTLVLKKIYTGQHKNVCKREKV